MVSLQTNEYIVSVKKVRSDHSVDLILNMVPGVSEL
jgi:hypothetical protein